MSASILVSAPVFLGLLGAGATVLLEAHPRAQRVAALSVLVLHLAAATALLAVVDAEGIQTVAVASRAAPLGIVLVADLLAAIMVVIGSLIALAVAVYGLGARPPMDEGTFVLPVYLALLSGISLAFLTGDLFNLFVAFELLLVGSYVLLTVGASRHQIRSGINYVVINSVGSLLFLTTVAFLYAATGTVNLAQLADRLGDVDSGVRAAIHLLLLVVFGLKAAVFPLYFWLPDAYPIAPAPITALFAGLLTKVGVYAIIRVETLLFPGGPSAVLLAVAAMTMVVGVFGAIAHTEMRRILSFVHVSQIGYMVFGAGLLTVAGVAAAIFYVVHHVIVKTSLFLSAGLVEHGVRTSALDRFGGLLRSAPLVAFMFVLPALSLAGMPPFSGFVAKLLLVQAGLDVGTVAVVAVSLVVSLLTLFTMVKIWTEGFWGDETVDAAPVPRLAAGATAALVAVTLVVAVLGGPLLRLTTRAAEDLVERRPYVEAVSRS